MKIKLIWDWPTRAFHWLLVASLSGQYITAEVMDNAMQWHFYLGYFTIGLLIFRLIWGFTGPLYARFAQFLVGPGKIKAYVAGRKAARRANAGHNAVGGWSVIIMLTLLIAQAVSGLFMSDEIFWDGPFYHLVDASVQSYASWVHHTFFDVILAVVALHITAVLFYVLIKKQPLINAMIHGKKATDAPPIDSSHSGRALFICAVIAVVIYWIISNAPTW
ncbi:cytochrome b/b6 domain-containing protein [Alteromonas ponticola]|uniref:Cytochrome B n=1 Tax=Alteromonas ponticola TaxID=2720613 RepID=A0ABX1QX90_9ALTE|nr:cytochrome b/b6 domain-containing protein [Alteromonas ponticola]NMH58835.1 cytochrome B [Alteromonas ponticola]